jgi:Ca-activated chloride channel family protein
MKEKLKGYTEDSWNWLQDLWPDFGNPRMFALLLPLAGIAAWYALKGRRNRQKAEAPFIDPGLLESVVVSRPKHRYVPPVMVLLGLTLLVFVAAEPQKKMQVPENRSTVMLVVDNSKSTLTPDVAPTNRLETAKGVIREVVQDERTPDDLNIGLVTFAETAQLLVPPTQNRELLLSELDAIVPQTNGTRTGEGVMTALEQLQTFAVPASAGQVLLISDGAETPPSNGIRSLTQATDLIIEDGYQLNAVAYGTLEGTLNGVPYPPDFDSLDTAATSTGGEATEAPTAAALTQALQSIPDGLNYFEVDVMHARVVAILVIAAFSLIVLAVVLARIWGVWFE